LKKRQKKQGRRLIPRHENRIDYEALFAETPIIAMRKALNYIEDDRMPGPHAFYISFLTDFGGVKISDRLRRFHPHDITIVLQHEFWDLVVEEERFSVTLSFDGKPERLSIPYNAIPGFIDPGAEVQFIRVST
jgi:hypothetical protein